VEEPPTPADSPLRLADIRASTLYRDLSTPKLAEGERAEPFRLPLLDPDTRRASGEHVDLRALLGRSPVALVFGSYT
jgi:hypothetical protein